MAKKIWIALLIAAGVLIALGIWRGELAVLFTKAANLCLECIGIG